MWMSRRAIGVRASRWDRHRGLIDTPRSRLRPLASHANVVAHDCRQLAPYGDVGGDVFGNQLGAACLQGLDDALGLSQHHLGCQVLDLVWRVVVLSDDPEVTHLALPRQPELVFDHEPPRRRLAAPGPRLDILKAIW